MKVLFPSLICFGINIQDRCFTETTEAKVEGSLIGNTFHGCLPSSINLSLSSYSTLAHVKSCLCEVLKGIKDEWYEDPRQRVIWNLAGIRRWDWELGGLINNYNVRYIINLYEFLSIMEINRREKIPLVGRDRKDLLEEVLAFQTGLQRRGKILTQIWRWS